MTEHIMLDGFSVSSLIILQSSIRPQITCSPFCELLVRSKSCSLSDQKLEKKPMIENTKNRIMKVAVSGLVKSGLSGQAQTTDIPLDKGHSHQLSTWKSPAFSVDLSGVAYLSYVLQHSSWASFACLCPCVLLVGGQVRVKCCAPSTVL